MQMSSLKSTQRVLLLNWLVAPGLAIWIWWQRGFLRAVVFVFLWLIADKIWDWVTNFLILGASRLGVNKSQALEIGITRNVPISMAATMLLDLIGTLTLPWLIAGFFLGWFALPS